jgi:uncharacterized protein YecE (DUF72 family)
VTIRVGTSGWQYADWRDPFYAGRPQRLWLTSYAERFDTVEVNATFYRLPKTEAVQRWTEQVPARFLFVVKASRYLTHIKRLRDPAEPVARLMDRIRPLLAARMLGPILLQFPPDMPAAPDLLAATLREFPSSVQIAVEPRHESWFARHTREVLEEHQAALVWADRDGRSLGPLWRTTDWCYLRMHHGRDAWGYDERDLAKWASTVGDVNDGYVFFNNDPGAAAVRDAATFSRLLAERPGRTTSMATTKQREAARRNVKKAQRAASSKRTIAHMPAKTKSALGKQGAAVAQRKRTGASEPKTRQELYAIAQKRDLAGRSKMGRDELARALGEK